MRARWREIRVDALCGRVISKSEIEPRISRRARMKIGEAAAVATATEALRKKRVRERSVFLSAHNRVIRSYPLPISKLGLKLNSAVAPKNSNWPHAKDAEGAKAKGEKTRRKFIRRMGGFQDPGSE